MQDVQSFLIPNLHHEKTHTRFHILVKQKPCLVLQRGLPTQFSAIRFQIRVSYCNVDLVWPLEISYEQQDVLQTSLDIILCG